MSIGLFGMISNILIKLYYNLIFYIYAVKKSLFLLIAILFIAAIAKAQTGWVTHKIDSKITVKFPSEPNEPKPGIFNSISKDSTNCICTRVEFGKIGLDSAALAAVKTTPEFVAEVKVGMKQSLPDVDLEDLKIGTWKGFTSYTTSGVNPKGKRIDYFMFIIGSDVYTLVTIRNIAVNANDKDAFFASVELAH